ncbi:hypothetical protein J27TS7_17310 [Paenibacillus dendritiformis]|nr:hypothetical protein J27TS7_17310 [Paenibacillus dendritiformis]
MLRLCSIFMRDQLMRDQLAASADQLALTLFCLPRPAIPNKKTVDRTLSTVWSRLARRPLTCLQEAALTMSASCNYNGCMKG